MELLQVEIEDHGIFARHNYPCPVCRKRTAVLELHRGIMQPCWRCQRIGWEVRKKTKFQKWKEKWFRYIHPTASQPHMESTNE